MQIEITAALLGYFLGSIPFGLVLAQLAGYGDIRKIGSGNIGATNVLRTGNKPLALATLLLDSGKGAIAVLLVRYIGGDAAAMAAGLFAIVGHCFPVWLKFKGGKGVATTLGMLIALAPFVGLSACAVWLATALAFRFSSLSALVAVLSAPFAAFFIYQDDTLAGTCGIIAMLLWIKHRANIHRLIKGEEPKIGQKKK
jgi:glycerol-3-phosphate acyltransferase PlsY